MLPTLLSMTAPDSSAAIDVKVGTMKTFESQLTDGSHSPASTCKQPCYREVGMMTLYFE